MDMWAYAKLVRDHASTRRSCSIEWWRQLTPKQRAGFKGTRRLLLKNPWNLSKGLYGPAVPSTAQIGAVPTA